MFCAFLSFVTANVTCSKGVLVWGQIRSVAQISLKDAYEGINVEGTFCAPQSGEYTFSVKGRNSASITILGSESGNNEWARCLSSTTSGSLKKVLISNNCYFFSARLNTGCGLYGHYIDVYVEGPGLAKQEISSNYAYTCKTQHCANYYYGSNCETQCDVDCNGNGDCDDGYTGNGKCICRSFVNDKFCEDSTVSKFDPGNQGLEQSVFLNPVFQGDTTKQRINDVSDLDFGDPYSSSIINGFIFIPQNGYYDFQICSTPGAVLTIDGNSVGHYSDPFICEYIDFSTYSLGKRWMSRGKKSIQIKLVSNCGMHESNGFVQWKFYRKYDNSNDTPWEQIPQIYFGVN